MNSSCVFQQQVTTKEALESALLNHSPLLWLNQPLPPASEALEEIARSHGLGFADIKAADELLHRWAPALKQMFPELASSGGLIESQLIPIPDASYVTGIKSLSRTFVKTDHALPVAGSIKARGGIYEVLAYAEDLATKHGLFADKNPLSLLQDKARKLFANYTIAVGSTGNLGLSIGVMASALGFHSVVHMSQDAKEWKKARLRKRGVEVIEHQGDYATAVAAGREEAAASDTSYFVDDENSRNLFLGYAVAALRLKAQFETMGVRVDNEHPLFVYLPCGVGGAPGGITFGLKWIFGDAVHCFFAEPCASPAMLVRMASEEGPKSVYDIGLDNVTEADGLAVAQASELVFELVNQLVSGVYTVSDDELYRTLARLRHLNRMEIEPSAAATFLGTKFLDVGLGRRYMETALNSLPSQFVTHLFWTTGGSFVPKEEYDKFYKHGCDLLALDCSFLGNPPSNKI